MPGKKFEEMSQEEKQQAFSKWAERQSTRKTTNTAKRAAIKAIIAAHQAEYDALLKGKPAVKK